MSYDHGSVVSLQSHAARISMLHCHTKNSLDFAGKEEVGKSRGKVDMLNIRQRAFGMDYLGTVRFVVIYRMDFGSFNSAGMIFLLQ